MNACRKHVQQLDFIDAHSMAPFATERPKIDDTAYLFDHVREHLPGERTLYEEAWQKVAQTISGYPNSAKFLTTIWPSNYSLLLCEADTSTAKELQTWVKKIKRSSKCVHAEVFEGDWRLRFRQPILASGDLVFFSFDPYVLHRTSVRDPNPGNMYPSDLECLATAIEPISKDILVQLSTYDANHANSQEAVKKEVRSRLRGSGLEIVATVRPVRKNGRDANGKMMSLVLARGVAWANSLGSLESRFQSWQSRAVACAR